MTPEPNHETIGSLEESTLQTLVDSSAVTEHMLPPGR